MDPSAVHADDYRAHAGRCLALADLAPTPILRALWLEEASVWRMLEVQSVAFDSAVQSLEAAMSDAALPDGPDRQAGNDPP